MSPAAWPIVVEIRVPWGDLDGAGHVNNARYFTYFETARVEAYFRITGRTGTYRVEDLDIILASTKCDFRAQANMGDVLLVSVRPGRVGETSFTFHYTITRKLDNTVIAEGESVQVCFDYEKQQKRRVPDDLRKTLLAP